jgi:hypothetical protein
LKIQIKGPAISGKVAIPPGDYAVSVLTDRSSIQLSGHGSDYVIPAVNRRTPNTDKVRSTTISFHSLGGNSWTLAVAIPKRGEWVAFINIEKAPSNGSKS